jgi:hypothetical protein
MKYVIEWQEISSLENDPFEETNSYTTEDKEDVIVMITNLLKIKGVYHVIVSQDGYD